MFYRKPMLRRKPTYGCNHLGAFAGGAKVSACHVIDRNHASAKESCHRARATCYGADPPQSHATTQSRAAGANPGGGDATDRNQGQRPGKNERNCRMLGDLDRIALSVLP